MSIKKLATLIGSELSPKILSKLKQESRENSKEVILLSTVDEQGFPNVALLSYLDITPISPKMILLAIGEKSSSKENMLRSKRGTLVLWGGKKLGMFYVKGKTKLVKRKLGTVVEGFTCSAISLTVEKVSQDYSPVAEILSTITYDTSQTNPAHLELLRELKKLANSI
ncbi:MAG: hypothetical protein ACREBS_05420 [Nitrososphaerales archaeon]